jgi:hypothetical protein
MIRSHTLVENYDYVSRYDEAVDRDLPDFDEKWRLYLDGAGEPPIKAGEKPTKFQLRHVSSTERIYLYELYQHEEKGLMLAAAAMALVGVTGLDDGSGKPITVKQEHTDVGPLRIRHASKETMDRLPVDVLLELGAVVVERLRLRPS